MTLARFARDHRRRWTAVLLGVTVGAAAAGGFLLLAPASYQATSQLFVTSTDRTADGDLVTDAATATQRVRSYARLATSDQVLTAVITELSLPVQPADLAARVSASAEPGTVFIDLSARDESPARARDIANAVAARLPIAIAEVDGVAPDIDVTVTTSAVLPTSPADRRPLRIALLGVGAGALLGLLVGSALSLRDNRFRSRRDVLAATSLPVLAELQTVRGHRLIADGEHQGGDLLGEGFRRLRTHLQHLGGPGGTGGPGIVLVTSADAGAGRSSVAVGLALALEQSGIETVLVDADLRRPAIAGAFGIEAAPGLTSLLTGAASIGQVTRRPWPVTGPRLITSGPAVPNPGDLLGSPRMAEVLRSLADSGLVVLVDAPPVLGVADTMALTRFVDGVLLAVRSGRTRHEQLADAVTELRSLDARVLGVALVATGNAGRRGRASRQPLATPIPAAVPVTTPSAVPVAAQVDSWVPAPTQASAQAPAPAPEVVGRITPPDTLAAAVESMAPPAAAPVEQYVEQPVEQDVEPAPPELLPWSEPEPLAEVQPLSSDQIPDGDHVQWFDLADVGAARAPHWEPVAQAAERYADDEPVEDQPEVAAAGWTTWETAVADEHRPEFGHGDDDQPSYDEPSFDQPSYDRPSYDQPSYDESTRYDQASYDQAAQYDQAARYDRADHVEPDPYQPEELQEETRFDAFLRPPADPAAGDTPNSEPGFSYRYQPEVPAPIRSVADLPRPSPNLEPITSTPEADWGSPWNEAPRPDVSRPEALRPATSWMHRLPSQEFESYEPEPYAQNDSRLEWVDGSGTADPAPGEPDGEPDGGHEPGRHALISTDQPVSTDQPSLPTTTAMALDAIRAQQITPGRRRR